MYSDKKDSIGKILLILSVFILIFLISYTIKKPFLSGDEFYTLQIVKLPFFESIYRISLDVHPPLYYIILKVITKFLTLCKIPYNSMVLLRICSIIPFFILILFSLTKIRKDYGWLTSGLFIFSISTLSEFSKFFLYIRMYSWGLLFLFLTFVFFIDVLVKSDRKSWILFTIFSILGCYTHYFVAIPTVILYLTLLGMILLKENRLEKIKEIKKWLISSVVCILLYIPWIAVVISQVSHVSKSYWIPPVTLNTVINFFIYAGTLSDYLVFKVLSLVILIVFLILFIKNYKSFSKKTNLLIISAFIMFLGTIVLGIIISFLMRPIIVNRYLIFSIGIIWFVFSIIASKLYENKKIFIPLIILLLVLGGVGLYSQMELVDQLHNDFISQKNMVDDLNNNNNVFIILSPAALQYSTVFFEKGELYSTVNLTDPNVKIINETDIPNILNSTDKDVYIIKYSDNKQAQIEKIHNLGFIDYMIVDDPAGGFTIFKYAK